jgi:hypothetical protein
LLPFWKFFAKFSISQNEGNLKNKTPLFVVAENSVSNSILQNNFEKLGV